METEIEETNLILMGREKGKQNQNTKTRQQNEMQWEQRVEVEAAAERRAVPPRLHPELHSTAVELQRMGVGWGPAGQGFDRGGGKQLGMRAVRNGR